MSSPACIDTRHRLSDSARVPDLLREQVLARPDEVAVSFGETAITYRELAVFSADTAAYLRHVGVGPDDCVGIFAEPSLELAYGVWGVLFAGGAYLPLSPEYPEERVRYMIEDSGASVIFCQESLAPKLAGLVPRSIRISTPGEVAEFVASTAAGTVPVGDDLSPDNLAYVIYTSGSTGRPKGVMIEHRSVVNQLNWLRDSYGIDREKVVLQKTPMSFDAAQWEILASACGARVVMGSPGMYRDPEALIDAVVTHRVTTLQCVPTLLQALLDTERLPRCTSLTQLFSGGEALTRSLAVEFVDAMPGCELINLYGPTECTINTSAFTVEREVVRDGPTALPIGAPVRGTRYHILDDERRPMAVGEVGELYIGGVQVARGYLNQPELTARTFVTDPSPEAGDSDGGGARLFRTGDLAHWNADGTVQFAGRVDNQVKLRGFRVELDEIRLATETHDWVRRAAVLLKDDPRTGYQNLVVCVELNPREAALMDQGNHGSHHQSKQSRIQVRAQLANPGLRDAEDLAGRRAIALPGREATEAQRRLVFARKTYRFFEGGPVVKDDLTGLLGRRPGGTDSRDPATLDLALLGEILRYFGQFHSDERLLPKYGYASPGSLYATQLYLESTGIDGVDPGLYYYHPRRHELVLITRGSGLSGRIGLHFIGRRRAIEPVYRNNIQEVLEIETGHMVGLFEEILPRYGLDLRESAYTPAVMAGLDCAADDHYLGTFELVPWTGPRAEPSVDIYLQAHPGKVADLPAGQYRYRDGELHRISADLILRKHVIAINQEVYERASVGVTVVSRGGPDWLRYIALGRTLQRLSMNDLNLGFMSAGYSSRSGDDLPSARRIDGILAGLDEPGGPSYFFVGGRVSDEQRRGEGMKEDAVHMRGPAEMIRDDLVTLLPDYMIPNKVLVLDALPSTANGKVDITALAALPETDLTATDRPFIAPRTDVEERIAGHWRAVMRRESVSACDDFFESGGNSLLAVGLINRLNREFGCSLPLQVLFDSPTVERLAGTIAGTGAVRPERVVRLRDSTSGRHVFCWPGLGGYPMRLRPLANAVDIDRTIHGVQAYGINPGETPYPGIREMAAADLAEIRRRQPVGPYVLWGYSFGARVAFEAARQLEGAGERVEHLVLIAPGSPRVRDDERLHDGHDGRPGAGPADFTDPAYVAVLFSVFAGDLDHPALVDCLRTTVDEDSFVSFIVQRFAVEPDLVARITTVARQTYGMGFDADDLARRPLAAPVTVFRARGDQKSFIDDLPGRPSASTAVVDLPAGHYSVLRKPDVDGLAARIRGRLNAPIQEVVMPHVNIKHHPVALTEAQQAELVARVTEAVKAAFRCDEDVISIALEPVDKEVWTDRVYIPEIVNRKDLLRKTPSY